MGPGPMQGYMLLIVCVYIYMYNIWIYVYVYVCCDVVAFWESCCDLAIEL